MLPTSWATPAVKPGQTDQAQEHFRWHKNQQVRKDREKAEIDYAVSRFETFKQQGEIEKERRQAQAIERAQKAKLLEEEEAAKAARARKAFVCGDAKGCLSKLYETVKAQTAKVGTFEVLFAVGTFLPDVSGLEDEVDPYLKATAVVPIETYFVDTNTELLHSAPGGKTICKNLEFLGAYGVKEICGLRVAYLSGTYNPSVYDTLDKDFVGASFTAKAVRELQKIVVEDPKKRGIDVLLTCGWPAGLDKGIEEQEMRPMISDSSAYAAPLAQLCVGLEPRYHLFGTADVFYQRPPFQTPKGHFCRCIGLGTVGSKDKERKWLHALSLSPMARMKKEDLIQAPPNVTPSPFKELKRSAPVDVDLPLAKKRPQQEEPVSDDDDAP